MRRKIALIGRSDLAESYQQAHPEQDYCEFFRPRYDITCQADCDRVVSEADADVYLISAGTLQDDAWTVWLTNCVGPSYLAYRLDQERKDVHIVLISSLASRWTSWPGITGPRLVYNTAKHAVSHFAEALYHANIAQNKITVIDPGQFKSRFNDQSGMPISHVADIIHEVITAPILTNIVNVQVAWHRDRINQPRRHDDK